MKKTNIVLIGMPSSGKSTLGRKLSSELDMKFIDTDAVIRESENRELKDIVNTDGLEKFLEIQEKTILGLKLHNYIIATGGGVVHGQSSMLHLKENGIIIYLDTKYEEIVERISEGRRFARSQGQSFQDLYDERVPLYRKYADLTIDCTGKQVNEICEDIKYSILKWQRSQELIRD